MAAGLSEDYEPLLQMAQEEEGELYNSAETEIPAALKLATRANLFLLCCSALAIVIAALNLSIWAFSDFHNAYATDISPKRRGNVYLGLSSVKPKRLLCRTRPFTYPTTYAVINGRDIRRRSKVHAHLDEVQFAFGGTLSAHVTFYIPDIGLENCTLAFRMVLPPAENQKSTVGQHDPHGSVLRPGYFDSTTTLRAGIDSTLNIYLLSSPDSLRRRTLVDQLSLDGLGVDGLAVTRPFWCPGQTRIYVQAECPGDCRIGFGLQGMTTGTSLYAFANKTGFVIEQYEHPSCIHRNT